MAVTTVALGSALALVFVVAAITKLRDRPGTLTAVGQFGVPPRLRRPVSIALPTVELAIAALLVIPATMRIGAVGATAMLVAFTLAMLRLIARGESPDCQCFGQLGAQPVGWSSIARNVVLIGAAVTVAVFARPDATLPEWWQQTAEGDAPPSLLLAGQALILVAGMTGVFVLLKRHASLEAEFVALRRAVEDVGVETHTHQHSAPEVRPGLPIGAPTPQIELVNRDGILVSLSDLTPSGTPAILVFVSPSCAPCQVLAPKIAAWEGVHGDDMSFVLISKGSAAANGPKGRDYVGRHFLGCETGDTARRFGADWTPAAVAVDANGRIASTIRYGEEAIADLVVDMVSGALLSSLVGEHPTIGAPLPSTDDVDTASLRGSEHLVVLWSEQCGYCSDMIPDFMALADDPTLTTRLHFVVDDEGLLAGQRFGASVAFDADFSLGRALGATGTPAAVLVDSDGLLRSQVATGADAILALLGVERRPDIGPVPVELGTRPLTMAPTTSH